MTMNSCGVPAVTTVRLVLPVLLVVAMVAICPPALCTDLESEDKTNELENFLGTDEAGNLAMYAQEGKDVSCFALQSSESTSCI